MCKSIKLLLVGLTVLGLCGCLQITDEFFINPDGSGKVIHEAVLTTINIGFGPQMTAQEKLKSIVQEELEEARGVDAWKDISYAETEDGKVHFKGTAYFKDIEKLQFHNAGGKISVLKESLVKKGDQELILELKNEPGKDSEDKPRDVLPENLTEEALQAKIAGQKAQFEQMKPMFDTIFAGMKITKIYHLPGEVLEMKNFSLNDSGAYEVVFEGTKMLSVMEELYLDKEWIKGQLQAGRDIFTEGPECDFGMNKLLFGEEGPVRLVAAGDLKPLFDYNQEVAGAREIFENQMQDLNLEAIVGVEEGTQKVARDVRVGGAQIVFESDEENDIRPFNWDKGYSLSLILTLPEEAVKVEKGKILKAVADDGSDLLPADDWAGEIRFINLGEDKKTVEFEVKLVLPPPRVRGIKEISGALQYMTSPKMRRVNLGFEEFSPGSKGKEYNAGIISVGKAEWQEGAQALKLKIGLAESRIKDIEVFGPDGFKIKLSAKNWMSSGSVTEYDLVSENPFPGRGRIDVQVYEGVKKHMMSFNLENVSLLGKPLEVPKVVEEPKSTIPASESPQAIPEKTEPKEALVETGAELKQPAPEEPPQPQTATEEDTLKVVLNEEVVIDIATKHAEAEGMDLKEYKKVKADYSFIDKVWKVTFQMDPMPPGGWFVVVIDDASGNVLELRKGL